MAGESAGDELIIRTLRRTDVDACIAMERRATPHGWSRDQLDSGLAAGNTGFAITSEGEVVSYCLVLPVPPELQILNLVVASEHQRKGIGRKLLDHVFEQGAEQGVMEAWLEVRKSNEAAIRLYRAAGFDTVSERKNYYRLPEPGQCEDALVMRRLV